MRELQSFWQPFWKGEPFEGRLSFSGGGEEGEELENGFERWEGDFEEDMNTMARTFLGHC